MIRYDARLPGLRSRPTRYVRKRLCVKDKHFERFQLERVFPAGRQYRDFLIQRWSSALVSSQLIWIGQEYEDLLAASFTKDFGGTADNLEVARLAAITLWGANARIQRLHASQKDYDFAQQAVAAVDTVQKLFGHLLKT